MLKLHAQRVLRRLGLHERLRASCIYDAYWRMFDSRRIQARDRELHFYRALLKGFRSGDLIFDIGANVGEKTDIFLRMGARVVAVEPDQRNQEVLHEKFIKYRLSPRPVTIVGQAVSEKISVATMWVDGPGSALNTLSQKWADTLRRDKNRFAHTPDLKEFACKRSVETTTIEQLTLMHGVPFFVKIDVEGHEMSTLRGMQQPVPYVSFEVNLPEFRQEGLQCLEVLGRLAPIGQFNYTADCKNGLALERWIDRARFSEVLDSCTERCIEVFCRMLPPMLAN